MQQSRRWSTNLRWVWKYCRTRRLRPLQRAEDLFEYCREYGHATEHHNAGFMSTASPPPNHCSFQLAPDAKKLGDVSNEPSQNAHPSTWSSCRDTACGQKRRSVGGRRDLDTVSLAVTPPVCACSRRFYTLEHTVQDCRWICRREKW